MKAEDTNASSGARNQELEAKLGRLPTESELADHLQLNRDEVEKMILEANAVNLISLDKQCAEKDGSKSISEIDILADKRGEDPTAFYAMKQIPLGKENSLEEDFSKEVGPTRSAR